MSDELDRFDESISVEALERIEPVCQAFEDAWKTGQRPEIDSFLGEFEDGEKASLLRWLLPLEIVFRRQRGSDPVPDEYCDLCADSAVMINAVFRRADIEREEHTELDKAKLFAEAQAEAAARQPIRQVRHVLLLSCPHCGSDIPLDDAKQQEVTCVNCGSTVDVDPHATQIYQPDFPEKIGPFQILERVGKGSFAVVYKAHDPELNQTVAIKVARPEAVDTEAKLERFHRDARTAYHLIHANIVRAHAVRNEGGTWFIVTDFIDGLTLDERLSGNAYSMREAADLLALVAGALQYAHTENVIHRDIKPSNILLDRAGIPYLTDFGLAHRAEEDIHLTLPGQIVGTPAYMSPEQARGTEADARSDVYSLGVVLFHVLTGELPFRGKRRMLLHQVQYDEPPPTAPTQRPGPPRPEYNLPEVLGKGAPSTLPIGSSVVGRITTLPQRRTNSGASHHLGWASLALV